MGDLVHETLAQSKQTRRQFLGDRLKTADKFVAVIIQLALLLFLINKIQLVEAPAFYDGFGILIIVGFIIHHLLPLQWRLPFFLLLTLVGIGLVFGITQGIWLIGLSLLLIALCHIPTTFNIRIALILLVTISLGLARAGIFTVPWSSAIWPILGSMFMFRLMLYLYFLRHNKKPLNIWNTLTYFFLLPNIIFPLFPIVDYATFQRTYYKDDAYKIYQRGTFWMAIGVLQLILYRYINLFLTLAPVEVTNIATLLQYFITDFLLLFRIMGQFHLIIGILHLFGFDLPRIFMYLFLSSSFSDFWRRANIYWKDFVVKLFFNPIYLRLRRRGALVPLVVATIVVFIATWFLHSYQWFWLRGSFLLTVPDILFWFLLGSLALINSIREQKRHAAPGLIGQGVRIAGTFAAMTILWSLWNSPTMADWFSIWDLPEAFQIEPNELIRTLAILTILILALVFVLLGKRFENHPIVGHWTDKIKNSPHQAYLNAGLTTALALLMIAVFEPPVNRQFGINISRTITSLSAPALSQRDDLMLTRGYYEELANVNRLNTELWQVYQDQPPDWVTLGQIKAIRLREDILEYELVPNLDIYYKRASFSTNTLGLRDQEYTIIPPDNTCRIALIGGSIVMGAGVSNREVFEAIVEERLNLEASFPQNIEILNFAVGGYRPVHRLASLEEKVLQFDPEAAIYVAHPSNDLSTDYMLTLYRKNLSFPDEIQQIFDELGIEESMSDAVIEKRMQTANEAILRFIYGQFVETSKANDILPIMLIIPHVNGDTTEEVEQVIQLGEEAGFMVIDLTNVYEGYEMEEIWLANWDHHPNRFGNSLIAEDLYQALITEPAFASVCSRQGQ